MDIFAGFFVACGDLTIQQVLLYTSVAVCLGVQQHGATWVRSCVSRPVGQQ